jgi:hypothetical protein
MLSHARMHTRTHTHTHTHAHARTHTDTHCVTLCLISTRQVLVPGQQTTVLLQPLLSDTEHKVTVTPVYTDGQDGISVSSVGRTCEYSLPCGWFYEAGLVAGVMTGV